MPQLNSVLADENLISSEEEFPSLRRRFLGLTIDTFVIVLAFLMAGQLIELVGGVPGYVRGAILIFMFFMYDPIFVSFLGGTIGHKLLRMKIVDVKTKGNIALHRAVIRFFVKGLLGVISFIAVSFNPSKRAIHDLWSNSIVVNNN
jgi:uncharacterized RDD family membrane protein YckC